MQKYSKSFAALQLFKRIESFVIKVQIINGKEMTVWIGRLILCHYQKYWTLMNLKILFETLMARILLN